MLSKYFNAWRSITDTQILKKKLQDTPKELKNIITKFYNELPVTTDCTHCKDNRKCFIVEYHPYCKCCLYEKGICHWANCHNKIACDGCAVCTTHLMEMCRNYGVPEKDIQECIITSN